MSEGQKFQLGTIGALSLSVVSSVSIVICNKALISTLGFTFGNLFNSSFTVTGSFDYPCCAADIVSSGSILVFVY